MSIPESVLREIERAMQAAEFPRGMSVHDGKAKVRSSHLRRLLAELTAMTAEHDRLREALVDACERMERARGILRKPGEFGWAMLDTAALRAALGER